MLIVTSRLTDVTVDTATLTAHVACGAKWGAVLAPAQEHGLAPLLGSTTDVGAVGYTLGGGMGWIGRRYGLAADSVRSFDVVLADGAEVRASAAENADLFWALRGGGGAFGVVTGDDHRAVPRRRRSTPATCCTRSRWPARSSAATATGSPAWTSS